MADVPGIEHERGPLRVSGKRTDGGSMAHAVGHAMHGESEYSRGSNRCVIGAHCTRHGGTPGFTNLVASKRNGHIELDPHVDQGCVIRLDKPGATVLRDALNDWLR